MYPLSQKEPETIRIDRIFLGDTPSQKNDSIDRLRFISYLFYFYLLPSLRIKD